MMLDTVKKALADNVIRLMDARRGGEARLSFAKRTGVGDGTLGRIMYGTGNPRLETLVQLATFFRVKPWELLIPAGADAEPTASSPVNFEVLTDALRLVAEANAREGGARLDPKFHARLVASAYRVLSDNVGMESAKNIVADLLATMRFSEDEQGVRGRNSR